MYITVHQNSEMINYFLNHVNRPCCINTDNRWRGYQNYFQIDHKVGVTSQVGEKRETLRHVKHTIRVAVFVVDVFSSKRSEVQGHSTKI